MSLGLSVKRVSCECLGLGQDTCAWLRSLSGKPRFLKRGEEKGNIWKTPHRLLFLDFIVSIMAQRLGLILCTLAAFWMYGVVAQQAVGGPNAGKFFGGFCTHDKFRGCEAFTLLRFKKYARSLSDVPQLPDQ